MLTAAASTAAASHLHWITVASCGAEQLMMTLHARRATDHIAAYFQAERHGQSGPPDLATIFKKTDDMVAESVLHPIAWVGKFT